MEALICKCCGSNEFKEIDGYRVCAYCGTKYPIKQSTVNLNDDVKKLLDKCKTQPGNAKKYANLILDIDPTNKEALKYL